MSEEIARLDDYVTGVLDDDTAAEFEEEMFAAVAAEPGELVFFDRAHRLLAWLTPRVRLDGPSTGADVEALRAAGLKVHIIELTSEKTDIDPWPEDVQVVVLACRVDIRGYEDVEVEVENPDGTLVKTFRGVLGEPDTGNVYAICAEPLAKLGYGTKRRISRFTGIRGGRRELITVYDTVPRP